MEQRQSGPHLLDLKIPLGSLLTFYGLLLLVYGLVTDSEVYEKSLGMNVNVSWGVLMLVVGSIFVAAHFMKKRRNRGSPE